VSRPETGTFRIFRASPQDVPRVAGTIATSFQHLAFASWLVPDQARRLAVMEANMTIWAEFALEHGMVDVIGDFDAVAVWFEQPSNAEPRDYQRRLDDACGPYAARFRQLDEMFAAHHPHEPHHHLAFAAVLPDWEGKGLGSALLNHHHTDNPGTACYLEASSARSRELYRRHGYTPRKHYLALPDDGPLWWPMWRDPAGPSH